MLKMYLLIHSKVKGKTEPKIEGRHQSTASQSSQHNKVTNSQFSVVISDTDSDDEAEKSDASPIASTSQGKKVVIADDDGNDGERDIDGDEEKAESETSSSRQPRSGNRAKCSRGRGASNMQAGGDGHVFKVSAFKPLSKQTSQSIKGSDAKETQNHSSNGSASSKGGEAPREKPEAVKATEDEKWKGKGKDVADMFKAISDSEEEEEFHEPTAAQRFSSAAGSSRSKSNSPAKSVSLEIPSIEGPTKKRKASEDFIEEAEVADDDEDDEHIDSVLGQAIQESEASSESEANNDYITKEEHEKAIRDLREEMKQELDRLKSAMRIETKRLIRTEVKDEIALNQER